MIGNREKATIKMRTQKWRWMPKKACRKFSMFFEASNRKTTAVPNCVRSRHTDTAFLR